MKLTDIRTALYRLPPTRPLGNARFTYVAFEYVIVDIATDDGPSGTGWAYTVGTGGSAVKALIDDCLAAYLRGRPALATVETHAQLSGLLAPVAGTTASLAIAAVDIALWDLKAKAAGLPLYQLLGSARDRVRICASGIDLNYSLPELVEEVEEWVDRGYAAVKVKVGKPTVAEDVARLEAVRGRLPEGTPLLADANQAWTQAEALRRARAFEPLELDFLEDPLPVTDATGYRRLRSQTSIPIAGGETLWSLAGFVPLVADGGLDIARNDVCRLSGITEWLRVAHLAEAHNVACAPHFVEEISTHLGCAVTAIHSVEHVPASRLATAGVAVGAGEVRDGYVMPPSEPGHGITFDRDRLAHHVVRD